MFAAVRGTRIYFDVEGMGLVPDGAAMRERPVAMVIHGGPGGDHSGFKPAFSPLAPVPIAVASSTATRTPRRARCNAAVRPVKPR